MTVQQHTPLVVGGRGIDAAIARDLDAHRRAPAAGFSLIEIMVVMTLMGILVVAGLNTVVLLDRSSRRQALHTSALELAQGKIEELQATTYNPPVSPFLASTLTQTN